METIAAWIKTIAATSIAGAVIYFLVPKGKSEKALRLVVSFSLIAAILSPFLSGAFKGDMDFSNALNIEKIEEQAADKAEEYAAAYNTYLLDESIYLLKGRTEEILDSLGFKYTDVQISTDITEGNSIVISKIKISVAEEADQDFSKAQEAVREVTGINPEFDVSDGV